MANYYKYIFYTIRLNLFKSVLLFSLSLSLSLSLSPPLSSSLFPGCLEIPQNQILYITGMEGLRVKG